MTDRPAWHAQAACNGLPDHERTRIFFPSKNEDTRPAKRICAHCAVRERCLDYALEHHERFGVWGGKSVKERVALRRRSAA